MSVGWFVTLSVIEIVLLVVVLALYLIAVSARLKSISATLAKVTFGVRAVEEQVSIGPRVNELNRMLREVADQDLPRIAEKAERAAS